MLPLIQQLISKIELLHLDPTPLVDLIIRSQAGELSLDNYLHNLTTLNDHLTTNSYLPGSQPISVRVMLRQIEQLHKNPMKKTSNVPVTPRLGPRSKYQQPKIEQPFAPSPAATSPPPAIQYTPEVVEILKAIQRDLEGLKNKEPTLIDLPDQQSASTSSKTSTADMGNVFVDPLSGKTDDLTANVKIDSKAGNNIQNKLDRLKQLKKPE